MKKIGYLRSFVPKIFLMQAAIKKKNNRGVWGGFVTFKKH